ncbi:ATP-binding protein [Mucilaginibacter sp. RS28]|uniref:histidine kinase n=1 Tax=Mucilaginibacter straminoryzae TaxID=2932774 RepID=A0A9X1X3M4_9SPHI|nr:ATP-binding protein [Mucilaginibacter straminoryzae]MCJ8210637.1 ATP-binding protein [Mucilaginibacter straminoryzae]
MNASAKIRVWLAIVCAALLLTAIVVQQTHTPAYDLKQSGKLLEKAIQKKETYVDGILNNPSRFAQLNTLPHNQRDALSFIEEVTNTHRIWLSTLVDGKLSFWSGVKVLAENDKVKEGRSFIKTQNGYYEAIKKSRGNFTAIFFIHVKPSYPIRNQYLHNAFDQDLKTENDLELADFTDAHVYNIHSIDGKYLFSVKLKSGAYQGNYIGQILLWTITFLLISLLINIICRNLARKGKLWQAVALLFLFIVAVKAANLLGWPECLYETELFNPHWYANGWLFPSFGDLCINVLLLCWFTGFIYVNRFRLLTKEVKNQATGYAIVVLSTVFLIVLLTIFVQLYYGMVVESNISFDVNNVLNLSWLSIMGITIVCVNFLVFNLIDETLLAILMKVKVSVRNKAIIFASGIIIATLINWYLSVFTLFYLLAGIIIAIRAWIIWYRESKISAPAFMAIIIISSLIASVKLTRFQALREHENRKLLIKKLEAADDGAADKIFRAIEKQIITDPYLIRYFKETNRNNAYLRTYFKKNYFDGYLAKYGFKIYEFDAKGQPLTHDNNYILDNFKDMVLYSAFKVSNYFYRENESFGFQSYFGLLPVAYKGENLGTFVIALQSKPLQYTEASPELLLDNSQRESNDFKGYSYAFYSDNQLLSQSGSYIYDIVNHTFSAPLKQYVFQNTSSLGVTSFRPAVNYNHLVYKPSARKLIIISKREYPVLNGITSLTFFFVFLLVFNGIVLALRWLWSRVKLVSVTENSVRWAFSINLERILYKTRIQFSMIFAVVVTLLLVAIITYFSISSQYQEQQNSALTDRILRIASALENYMDKDTDPLKQETQVSFNAFADAYSADLNLFDRKGNLLFSTQPKVYRLGLLMPKMNGKAFIYMNKLQKSELVNTERIGDLNYKAGYAPIRNNRGETIAFLQLPFFSNELEYRERLGSLLNAMINIYAIIFILIGSIAILIAQQITSPLSFIQHSLSKTIYGRKNEPIVWERDDEIGALVAEYNKMIAELENSANRLAQSERESAWREMAKQVAHEIKNPLTPLKLGLQLLEKSWKDKDPRFDAKFERFSKSFVEQIESLSTIASEFSAFAKMPETRMQRLNIFEMLHQAVVVYRQMDNVLINLNLSEQPFFIMADRDQLLRCFNNLLKNAIEAMPPGHPGIIDINYLINDHRILINIKDNGSGIPENLRNKIFEPNFTTKSSGTGLGLAFVKNSIENAGGKVWFETEIGVGTIFHLSLPAAHGQEGS